MKLRISALAVLLFSGSIAAQDIKITGTLTQRVHSNGANQSDKINKKALFAGKTKDVVLLNIQLSENAKQDLVVRAKNVLAHPQESAVSSFNNINLKWPQQVQLGMNNVPVLDQGLHGSCVTFAVTATIDALLNKGDYLSQLCQLQLGSYFEKNGYSPSGWDGSLAPKVLGQMEAFGFVTKEQQQRNGCGGLTQYPIDDSAIPISTMTPEEYHQMSEPFEDYNEGRDIFWSSLLDVAQAQFDHIDPQSILDEVKATLNAGDRITFGTLLWDVDLGVAGALGTKKLSLDTWVLTPEIARDVYTRPLSRAGHEMIITGYDDAAVAVDDKGRKHYGLLTLRNSWGTTLGDHGDFYMSYDYFKMFVIEVERIRLVTSDNYQ